MRARTIARRLAATLLSAGALCAAVAAPAQAQLSPGDIVVADSGAEAIFKVDPATGAVSVLATPADFISPTGATGVALDAEGNVLVADPALTGGTGAIFRFIPGQAPAALATSGQFVDPHGVALDAQGNVVVADRNADPDDLGGNPGAIFRFAPGQAPAVLAGGPLLVEPTGVAVDAQGSVVVADADANPPPALGDGAIFRFAPGQAPAVLATSDQFAAPFGVALDAQGNVLVADASALGGPGAIFRFAPGQAPAVLATSDQFVAPLGVALDAQGNVLVADASALGGPGAIFRFAPGQAPAVLATSPLFEAPSGVAVVPPKCSGRFATIVGDDGANTLRGTAEDDVIWGGGGKDKLVGRGGKDRICGENGKDRLLGGKARDRLNGGRGADRLFGGTGRDVLKGGKGPDRLAGGKGKDTEKQ